MRMFTGDLKPDLEITLSADDEVDISDAISVRIIGKTCDGGILFDRPPHTDDVVGPTSVVTMQWQPADTDAVREINVEVEVMWPGGMPQTFRAEDIVDVVSDFDAAAG